MYQEYFGFKEPPFSIAPDPHYLYMTTQHREALAHLVYGLNSDGGCILLTGEVGTGKTTICRCLLEQVPENANIALLLNPKVSAIELLETICDEFKITYPQAHNTVKTYIDLINHFLLEAHAKKEKAILIIDEAQNLDVTVLEQLRLLTNLETNQRKLLQIIIIGQPELLDILSQEKMRQLAQRITARFHLQPLSKNELKAYIAHRLAIAGQNVQLFPDVVLKKIYQISKGIPRLINVICDRALLGTYVQNKTSVDVATLNQAAKEIFGEIKNQPHRYSPKNTPLPFFKTAAVIITLATITAVTATVYNIYPEKSGALQANYGENNQSTIATGVTDNHSKITIINKQAITIEPTSTDEKLLQQLITQSNSNKTDAYHRLFSLWKLDYAKNKDGNACEFAKQHNLSCLHRSGNLHSLRKLNRPAIIKIYSPTGENTFATVMQLDEKKATINANGQEIIINLTTLDTHWFGDYTLLWQKPPFYSSAITPGKQGPVVQWLDQQLAKLYGQTEPPTIRDIYSEKLVSQIKTFQLSKGLYPDGIAGPRTLIHLNNALGLRAPQLSIPRKARAS